MKTKITVFVYIVLIGAVAGFTACGGKKKKTGTNQLALADTAQSVLFVAKVEGITGVWRYNLQTNSSVPVKADRGEVVAETATNEKHDHAYFITVNKFGREGVLPYFVNARLYVLDLKTMIISRPIKLGNGIQLSAFWDDDTTINIAINKIQSSMASHVSQQRLRFGVSGKLKHDESQVYDFTRVGFPILPRERVRLLSLDKTFSLEMNDKNAVFLHGGVENPKLLAGQSTQRLHAVRWSSDGNYLVFSMADLTSANPTLKSASPQTATLYIFSLTDNLMLKVIPGGGYKHFDVIRDMVIYDDNFGDNSRIHIYDMKQRKETEMVSFAGGCGLQNIPQFPDYGK